MGPAFEVMPYAEGFWPAAALIPSLEKEALEFQLHAHWLSGAAFELGALSINNAGDGNNCSLTVNVRYTCRQPPCRVACLPGLCSL